MVGCTQGAIEEVLVTLQERLASDDAEAPSKAPAPAPRSNNYGAGARARGQGPPQRDRARAVRMHGHGRKAPREREEKMADPYEREQKISSVYDPAVPIAGPPRQGVDDSDMVRELKETIQIMDLKIKKMEQLIRLKDEKITKLQSRLNSGGGAAESLYPESREYYGGAGY